MVFDTYYKCPCGYIGHESKFTVIIDKATYWCSSDDYAEIKCPKCGEDARLVELCGNCLRPIRICEKDKTNCKPCNSYDHLEDGEPLETGDKPLDVVLNDMADDANLVQAAVGIMLNQEVGHGG